MVPDLKGPKKTQKTLKNGENLRKNTKKLKKIHFWLQNMKINLEPKPKRCHTVLNSKIKKPRAKTARVSTFSKSPQGRIYCPIYFKI